MISTIAAMLLLAMDEKPASLPTSPPPPIVYVPAPPAPRPPPPPPPPVAKSEHARARANLGSLVSDADYPASALRAREEGVTGFRLEIGPNGRVTGCTITQSSGSAALDAATCRLLTSRARFQPARDSLGNPVSDRISARMVWRIADDVERPWTPALYVEEIRGTAAGAVSCRHGWDSGPLEEKPCKPMDVVRMSVSARAAGKAIERIVVTKLTPEGAAEPGDPPNLGAPFLAADAVFRIGADGSLLECRLLSSKYLGPERKSGAPPSPCLDWDTGSKLYLPSSEGEPTRTVRVEVRGYARAPAGRTR